MDRRGLRSSLFFSEATMLHQFGVLEFGVW